MSRQDAKKIEPSRPDIAFIGPGTAGYADG
jgi:hypothetical protein